MDKGINEKIENIFFIDNFTEIPANNSSFLYGDAIFETMLADSKRIYNFKYHKKRAEYGCKSLDYGNPRFNLIKGKVIEKLAKRTDKTMFFIVKVMISRGCSERGYKTTATQQPIIYIQITDFDIKKEFYHPKSVFICNTRLGLQPLTAGIKHCNRIEQVIAKRELLKTDFFEGLMFNINENLIEGIISNVFIFVGGELLTADLSNSGVSGTMRSQILDLCKLKGIKYQVREITKKDLLYADELFLTNAIFGIIPVSGLFEVKEKREIRRFNINITNQITKGINHPCSKLF